MLPKNNLRKQFLRHLHIFEDDVRVAALLKPLFEATTALKRLVVTTSFQFANTAVLHLHIIVFAPAFCAPQQHPYDRNILSVLEGPQEPVPEKPDLFVIRTVFDEADIVPPKGGEVCVCVCLSVCVCVCVCVRTWACGCVWVREYCFLHCDFLASPSHTHTQTQTQTHSDTLTHIHTHSLSSPFSLSRKLSFTTPSKTQRAEKRKSSAHFPALTKPGCYWPAIVHLCGSFCCSLSLFGPILKKAVPAANPHNAHAEEGCMSNWIEIRTVCTCVCVCACACVRVCVCVCVWVRVRTRVCLRKRRKQNKNKSKTKGCHMQGAEEKRVQVDQRRGRGDGQHDPSERRRRKTEAQEETESRNNKEHTSALCW